MNAALLVALGMLAALAWRTFSVLLDVDARCARLQITLDVLRNEQRQLTAKENDMAKTLDDVLADVQANTTVTGSAITLLQSIKAQLDAAIASNDPAKVQAVADALEANTQALAAAVTANTPAA